jgi:ATP-dependent exoDNAse (exonuclease V) beta subunit
MDEDGPEIQSQPGVIALPAPRPYGNDRVAKYAIDACLPHTIGAFVEWLVNQSGWQVRNDSGEWVPVRARHVCVLFRRFLNFGKDLTRDYVHALESRGIPHLLVGSKSFHHREEVEAIRTALTAIEWPEDELAVFALLRGSLFAFGDDVLLRFKHEFTRLHPFRRYPEVVADEFRPVKAALGKIAELHRLRNRRAIADTINVLLEHVRAHAGFALRPSGQQVLANVLRICDLARTYEVTGGFSFRGFVDELNAQAEKAESAEAPVLEEASDGVRIMTVHTAKGLEFPVVILADMTANLHSSEPDRYVDAERGLCASRLLRSCSPRQLLDHVAEESEREKAEGVRVCYVAATRARDLLVFPVLGDGAYDGWLSPLNKAAYPERRMARQPLPCGYIDFTGDATVLWRPFAQGGPEDESIRPGLHKPESGEHHVLWWDPAALYLDAEQSHGLANVNVLKEGAKSPESVAAYTEWRDQRARRVEASARPEFDIANVTEIDDDPPEYAVTFESAADGALRPSGRIFGTLVHAIMRDVPAKASLEEIKAVAAVHASIVSADPMETAAAVACAAAVLKHGVWSAALSASAMYREMPVTMPLPQGRILEGVLDLAYKDSTGWVVVDYKTDADMEMNRDIYVRQLRWYLHSLATATGEPARGILLQV